MSLSPSWDRENKRKQRILQKQNGREEDQICKDYIMC
jgi:hypothetical protein